VTSARDHHHIVVTRDGEHATVRLTGEFDMSAAFTVEPALERALAEPGVRALTVDLSDLSFIDSTGIGILLRLSTGRCAKRANKPSKCKSLPGEPTGISRKDDGRRMRFIRWPIMDLHRN